jgi:hypothetical protein
LSGCVSSIARENGLVSQATDLSTHSRLFNFQSSQFDLTDVGCQSSDKTLRLLVRRLDRKANSSFKKMICTHASFV